jgi:hypothetical protein
MNHPENTADFRSVEENNDQLAGQMSIIRNALEKEGYHRNPKKSLMPDKEGDHVVISYERLHGKERYPLEVIASMREFLSDTLQKITLVGYVSEKPFIFATDLEVKENAIRGAPSGELFTTWETIFCRFKTIIYKL